MINVRRITPKDIVDVVKLYLAYDDGWLPVDYKAALRYVRHVANAYAMARGGPIGLIAEGRSSDSNLTPLGFLIADYNIGAHTGLNMSTVRYFCTLQEAGKVKKYRVTERLHGRWIAEASIVHTDLCIAEASHMDDDRNYIRILEKIGWETRGHVAIRRLSDRAKPSEKWTSRAFR